MVEAVGAGVTEFKPGDHVVSGFFPQWPDGLPFDDVGHFRKTPGDGIDGYASEYVVGAAIDFTLAPRGWSHAGAATITTAGLTAWRALVVDGRLKTGASVLVLGTGGVSIAALQIAKAMGARVIVTSSSDDKLERARALGADEVVEKDFGYTVQAAGLDVVAPTIAAARSVFGAAIERGLGSENMTAVVKLFAEPSATR